MACYPCGRTIEVATGEGQDWRVRRECGEVSGVAARLW